MTSLARRHYQRVTAAVAAGDAVPGRRQTGDQYELHQAALWEAKRTLKGIKSTEAKIEKKRELLPQFDSYVSGVIEAGTGAQDDVLVTIMLWRLDIGDLGGALAIGQYALSHGLTAPDQFKRDTPTIVAEQAAEEALKQLDAAAEDDAARIGAELVAHLSATEAMTRSADMHDQVRAKLHKALGYALRTADRKSEALDNLQRALQLDARAGVKKDIERLERELRNTGQGTTPA